MLWHSNDVQDQARQKFDDIESIERTLRTAAQGELYKLSNTQAVERMMGSGKGRYVSWHPDPNDTEGSRRCALQQLSSGTGSDNQDILCRLYSGSLAVVLKH
jgi:hypothetical protein